MGEKVRLVTFEVINWLDDFNGKQPFERFVVGYQVSDRSAIGVEVSTDVWREAVEEAIEKLTRGEKPKFFEQHYEEYENEYGRPVGTERWVVTREIPRADEVARKLLADLKEELKKLEKEEQERLEKLVSKILSDP
ncbi:MAG: hypothetical protein ACXQTI_01315 [Candidatus Nezhaarchaeales archaeon]